ncbi:MAG: hypothetical protein ACK6DA_06535 [Candidatus Kapaibacterium sp.]
MKYHAPHQYDADAWSKATGIECPEPTLTQQQFAEEADINTIVKRFGLTGQLPQITDIPQEGEFVGITSFHEAMNTITRAHEAFDQLPAEHRRRFNNDPGNMLAFVSDDNNRAEAEKMGLVIPPKTPYTPPANPGTTEPPK